jgi:hypothetical protein
MKNLSMPLALDDQALVALKGLALPLEPPLREPFLRSVLNELANYAPDEIGPGLVGRIARTLQREFQAWRRV